MDKNTENKEGYDEKKVRGKKKEAMKKSKNIEKNILENEKLKRMGKEERKRKNLCYKNKMKTKKSLA